LQETPWAVNAGIKTGADYLRAWVACAFRDPFEPTPYLFLFGSENCGKSILHEALQLLITKGVVQAKRTLTSEFNGELAGAIICAVEEIDISKSPGAHAKIKEYVTGLTISIRKMRHDSYEQPNMTHWIQTANKRTNCPVFEGDTRITMIYVPDLLPDQIVPKPKMKIKLQEEAPHFLYTLMHLALPPYLDRLRIPIVATASKKRTEEENRSALDRFISEHCVLGPSERVLFKDFIDRFYAWLPPDEKHLWSRPRIQRELPPQLKKVNGAGNALYYSGLSLKPERGEKHG
jgi:phage/plasmid-associated DNA primase